MLFKYRTDIDGLRGVAVAAVVLFHANVPGFKGGYVGVDVFFVVSGFLITSLLLQQSNQASDILFFYERRIRRIFPALFCVLVCCAALAAFVLLPSELNRFGRSLVATALFVPNFFFWRQGGYFAPSAENAPLLHLWSLGVEEQFYLLYPVALLLIRKFFNEKMIILTAGVALISFVLSVWGVANHPVASFYLAPFRIWELLLGALISMRVFPELKNRFLNECATSIGIVLIGLSVIMFSVDTDFPGFSALMPCVGTALVVYAGAETKTLVTRVLSVRPIVFVGLISYSLYLWHWPLLAFSRFYAIRTLDPVETGAVILVAVLISTASWKFVEKPFRRRDGLLKGRGVFKAAGLLTAPMILLGFLFVAGDGFPQRFAPAVHLFADGARDINPDRRRCLVRSPAQIQAGNLCELGDRSLGEPQFIIWGDSHADSLMPALKELAETYGRYGLIASSRSCPPLVGIEVKNSMGGRICEELNDAMLSMINNYDASTVILIAYWQIYTQPGRLIDKRAGFSAQGGDDTPFARALNRMLSQISQENRKVWLVQQVPDMKFDTPSALAMAARRGIERDFLRPSVYDHELETSRANAVFAKAVENFSLSLLNPQDFLCDETRCLVEHNGRSLYSDYHHLSTVGTQFLRPGLEVIFRDMAPRD